MHDLTIQRTAIGLAIALLCLSSLPRAAHAHGIAGNRFFPGTMTFDDPAVNDELSLQLSHLKHPAEDGGPVTDSVWSWSFMRLLTPDIAVGIDSGVIWRDRSGFPLQTGTGPVNLSIKALLYKSEPHETLISAGLAWGIGQSGTRAVGGDRPDILQPGLFFGKGFGDLPASFSFFRPFAITGAITADLPASREWPIEGVDPTSGALVPTTTAFKDTMRWGFALEYSTLYLTDRFTGGPPKEEPLYQLVPLVEFAFVSPAGEKTAATMNPGLSYVAKTYQVAAEAIVPLNNEAGRGVGFRMQLLFFLDDLLPSVFGKPLLSSRSTVSVVETFGSKRD
jgi:hypothetical protein